MARAMSMARRDVLAFAREAANTARRFEGHRIALRRIATDRNVHAAIALAHFTLAVAFSMAMGDVIGPLAGAGVCLSAGAVALLLLLRAGEPPAAQGRAEARLDAGVRRTGPRAPTGDSARREVSGLLALMNHELRTPLNAILGNADVIRLEALGPAGAARYRECAGHIREGGQTLLRATEDMLALTSAVAAATFASHQPVNLEEAVQDVLRQSAPAAKTKGIDLSWQSATDRAVLSEATALRHAISRIIEGAMSHASAGAGIHVELTPGRGTVELLVTLTYADHDRNRAARVDHAADCSPAALQMAASRTLLSLLGTHLHAAHGIDGRWRAIVDLQMVA